MPFCAITPTRGQERGNFLNFLAKQIIRMTVTPDRWYIMDDPPKSDKPDLVYRIIQGIEMAQAEGYNEVFILEDDDFYAPDYFEHMVLGGADFVGCEKTTYYNLNNRTWQTMEHKGRSSLFHTGFKISALEGFRWPSPEKVFLDIPLWEFAKKKKFVESKAVGIKHSVGLCAGRGHQMMMKNSDNDFKWLKANVDKKAFEFYQTMI